MAGSKRSGRKKSRSDPGRADGRAINAILFLTLGIVGAFAVSSIAGFGDGGVPTLDSPAAAPADPGAPGPAWNGDPAGVRVEVLNGAGVSGLARDATHRLRADGFDVVFFGNAMRFDHGRTVVVDRTGTVARARAVARALGVDSVAAEPDSTLMLEVTVILGDDWPPAVVEEPGLMDRLRALLPGEPEGR